MQKLMLKTFLRTVLFSLICVSAAAQPKGYKLIADKTELKNKLALAAETIQTIKSDFSQEINLNVLSEKIISAGIFMFKKENMVRMEYLRPYRHLMIINKDKVLFKDEQKTNMFSSHVNKLFTLINSRT